jgi:hypothetical protein
MLWDWSNPDDVQEIYYAKIKSFTNHSGLNYTYLLSCGHWLLCDDIHTLGEEVPCSWCTSKSHWCKSVMGESTGWAVITKVMERMVSILPEHRPGNKTHILNCGHEVNCGCTNHVVGDSTYCTSCGAFKEIINSIIYGRKVVKDNEQKTEQSQEEQATPEIKT